MTSHSAASKRSLPVTLLAWFTMLASALLTPISVISLLMILAGAYGTQTWDPVGFFIVVVAPPLSFLAGLGLLLRWRVARYYMFLLLAAFIVANIRELASGGKSTTVRTTADGVVTTSEDVWGGPNYHSVPIIAFCTAAIAVLLLPSVRREFSGKAAAPARDWRVGHRGRDQMYYEELRGGEWRRIEINGEMLMGQAHHVIYFATPAEWQKYPEWARERRDEIIGRIKSEFRPPDYGYFGESAPAPAAAALAPAAVSAAPPAIPVARKGSLRAAVLVAVCLFGFSGWMAWLVKSGLDSGTVKDVILRPSLRSPVTRAETPAKFWFLVTVYCVGGAGTAGLAVFVLRFSFLPGGTGTPGRKGG